MYENKLLERIAADPEIFGGKSISCGRRFAADHVLGMLAAVDSVETFLEGYPWHCPHPNPPPTGEGTSALSTHGALSATNRSSH